jgi:H+/Cl- antiporter ClcA
LILGQFCNPIALKAIGWKYYILFCVILALFVFLVYFLFPETKGHTLEEIAEVFDGNGTDSSDEIKNQHKLAETGEIGLQEKGLAVQTVE